MLLATTRKMRYLLLTAALLTLLYVYHDRIVQGAAYRWKLPINTGSTSITGEGEDFKWRDLAVKYPVESLQPLPTGEPKKLPKVQFTFPPENANEKSNRLSHQTAVKDAFSRCWSSYMRHAWMADELAPLSGGMLNVFGGWAATLVDSLDTLWIMDMKTEFEDAVTAAVSIDFSGSSSDEINVFETTIRYLGGFLSAYDLSRDGRLLSKAVELGDMLLFAFDTPNRMPITRWKFNEAKKGYPQFAHSSSLVAEVGSLAMEFTRLSQVTEDPRWYDATYRVMKAFDEQQELTRLKGMWPVVVNARDLNFTEHGTFTLGAMSDSLYEYLPKMHALLGGLEPMYEKMYKNAMAAAMKYNLWRPMTPDKADILLSGNALAPEGKFEGGLELQGQHLVCFAGGMFALGGRLFDDLQHVEIGRKLTDGCIWTYQAMPLGIMPEVFHMAACPTNALCEWNETIWKEDIMRRAGPKNMRSAETIIEEDRLPPGFSRITDTRYILRPEAIESVFILYRITGRKSLLDSAWAMFTAIQESTKTHLANGALADVTDKDSVTDSMESFWLAETLKYFYLMFSEPDVISLDRYVFNTEAHPFERLV
ncbi:hypothetical protein M8818_006229 [Zalaria obscura]|uniref:Uncharacterized protein n=1 Tax=Zalaria obscura TaxID=2024903 RepID=A0ACC3S7V7_9PEZI